MAVQFDDEESAPPSGSGSVVFDDEKPSYLQDVGSNALKEIKALPEQIPTMAKSDLGLASVPVDLIKAGPQMMGGKDLADTDIAKDVKPIIEGNKSTLNTIEHPIESFRKAPINTAGTALGLLGGFGEMVPETPEAPNVPHETIPEAPAVPPETPKDLPIVQPGAKTGAPHALFAYNDEFGPEGAPRSVYNIYGDPSHPSIKSAGWGSSVAKEKLGDIPITGREPRSTAYEPIEKAPEVVPMAGKGPAPEPASRIPPDPNAPPPPAPPKPNVDPL